MLTTPAWIISLRTFLISFLVNALGIEILRSVGAGLAVPKPHRPVALVRRQAVGLRSNFGLGQLHGFKDASQFLTAENGDRRKASIAVGRSNIVVGLTSLDRFSRRRVLVRCADHEVHAPVRGPVQDHYQKRPRLTAETRVYVRCQPSPYESSLGWGQHQASFGPFPHLGTEEAPFRVKRSLAEPGDGSPCTPAQVFPPSHRLSC